MNINEIVLAQNPWWIDAQKPPAPDYRRELHGVVLKQLVDVSDRRAVVLRGPRQVGKTTILWQIIGDLLQEGWPPHNILYFDFSDERITSDFEIHEVVAARPEGQNSELPGLLLFDEVGRARNWDQWLKRIVDELQDRVVVTDSSSTILRSGSMESGLGRWDEVILEGMNYREFLGVYAGDELSIDQVASRQPHLAEIYLRNGGFPEHARNENILQVSERLREDIVGKAILQDLVRYGVDVQGAKRLFVYLIQNSGLILNVSDIAKEIGGRDRRSVSDWVELLEDTQLVYRLDRYATSPASKQKSHPKYYASDHGLINALSVSPVDENSVRGKVIEAVAFRHLREIARSISAELYFYRNNKDEECDFILAVPGLTIAVEVTSSRRVRSEKIAKLVKLINAEKWDRGALLYSGFDAQEIDGIKVLPVSQFLISPQASLGISE